jgi:hypothetical protein
VSIHRAPIRERRKRVARWRRQAHGKPRLNPKPILLPQPGVVGIDRERRIQWRRAPLLQGARRW